MQSNTTAAGKELSNESPSLKAESKSCGPELITVEVANLQGELVVVHNKPQDGSALEAAAELHKLTEVLNAKAAEIKALADQAFLGEARPQLEASAAAQPEAIDQIVLHTDVQEAVDDLRDRIAEVHDATPKGEANSPKQAADHAHALDKVVEVLESSSEQISDLKVALTAKELNNMDGFDR